MCCSTFDLHARPEPRWAWSTEPAGSALIRRGRPNRIGVEPPTAARNAREHCEREDTTPRGGAKTCGLPSAPVGGRFRPTSLFGLDRPGEGTGRAYYTAAAGRPRTVAKTRHLGRPKSPPVDRAESRKIVRQQTNCGDNCVQSPGGDDGPFGRRNARHDPRFSPVGTIISSAPGQTNDEI